MNLNTIASLLSQTTPINTDITGVCTDSRVIEPGQLFVALSGENFDGHDYLPEVEKKGALAAIVSHAVDGVNIPQLVVPDPLMALAKIAAAHRQNVHCPVIALTGSNGKTTVKEMIAAILPVPSHATKGNLNNHIGAPLSVLGLTPQHQYAVFELGANHPGEIAHTVAIVHPDVTLINNIAPAHVEGFGSIDGVAKAKGEIHQGLHAEGVAVVNEDDAYAHFWDDILADKKVLRYSLEKSTDVYAHNVQLDDKGCSHFVLILPNGQTDIHLKVPGLHNVRNALAAATCCYAVGIPITDIQEGLNGFVGVKGRMTMLTGKNNSLIIDDSYNANLRSVLSGLEVLAKCAGTRIFVFGDMGELGQWSEMHHQEVGLAARELGIDQLWTCGQQSALTAAAFGAAGRHCESKEAIVSQLLPQLGPNTTVLVKGSRSSAMEKIVMQLQEFSS